ncbi:hypothetical protein GLAREA_02558 [Glarea lozoyensis ATCC 20868]|uniref:Uncharacterized protein n=1 Tax=Glarea lozoyensis (strain ATCC 20868 / MF5171) TaxID=1116229 RepID=S3CLN2_GLAL2|nr:uncharacterized protein GLAREA_02558 [Glarea lozoyensis ATCC 20868]EPE26645.1 hypothetical protein GLAREA_02558 [Glarea lozoyensis ATCC 20868]
MFSMLHFGRLLAFAARVELPQLPYVDEGEYDLTQAMLYMFSVCSVTTSFSLKIIAQDTLLDTGSKHYSSAFVINSELLHTIGNVVVVWNLCNTICASFIPPVASSKIIATRLPPIAPVCLLMDLVSFVAMVVLSALCYASLSPLATIMNGTLSWAQIINESRSILAMAVGLFAGCCQGSLAISLISTYSSEKERAEVMRGLDQDGWLRYLDNFQQTDHDLVAFLKIPALSEKVRDRIASKIYNLPQDDSCRCNRWNRIRRYPLAKEELERYRSDQKVILHGLFPPTVSEDLELGIPQ